MLLLHLLFSILMFKKVLK